MLPQTDESHYQLESLADGVFTAIARDGGAAISNAGLVDLGDATLVIDAFLTPSAATVLRADALRLTGRLPRWVINTHYHNDHIWGSQVFLPDAELISSAITRAMILTEGKKEYDEYKTITGERYQKLLAEANAAQSAEQRAALALWLGYFGGLARDFPRLKVCQPNLVFEGSLEVHGSQRDVRLIETIGAHTASDSLVFLPADGIVFMSDLLFVGFHPYLADGSPQSWLELLESVLDGSLGIQDAERFVPGHGPVGTRANVQLLADYIRDCQEIAARLRAQGKTSPEDIAAVPIPTAYAAWKLPRFFTSNLNFLIHQS